MSRVLRLLPVGLLLLGTMLLPAGTARAAPPFTEAGWTSTYSTILDYGQWTYFPNGDFQFRGMQIESDGACAANHPCDPRMIEGLVYITNNGNCHRAPDGMQCQRWGTTYTVSGGSVIWRSTFTAQNGETYANVHIVGHGFGPYAGLHVEADGQVEDGQMVYTGRIW